MTDTDSTTENTEAPGLAFLQFTLGELLEDKDQLKIETKTDELGILHTISVSENDMGKIIGKGGQTIKALRTLIRILGSQSSQRVNLKILEPAS